ncbi:MAG: translation initiation factor IF-2 [Pseudomonadota bacterium]
MSETKDKDGSSKTLTLSASRTVDAGQVRQNFSHGRSKNVVVEKRTKRTFTTPKGEATAKVNRTVVKQPAAPAATTKAPARKPSSGSVDGRTLSNDEKDARLRALQAAKAREAEEKVRAEEEAKRRAEAEAKRAAEEAEAKRLAAAEAKRKEAAGEVDDKPAKPVAPEKPAAPAPVDVAAAEAAALKSEGAAKRPAGPDARKVDPRKRAAQDQRPQPRKTGGDDRRTRGKLTINNALDEGQRERSLASLRRRREREKSKAAGTLAPRDKIARNVTIPEAITIQELANRMAERGVDVIKFLMKEGEMHKINDVIDADTAELIATEFGHTPNRVAESDVLTRLQREPDDDETLEPRAPIVTIMGHVDHGKTSLLDALREANVVQGEAGGITQHIGAYRVKASNGAEIAFIDTPGHEAFTAMRARGAQCTDIVVLVVAANDGVMPQTIEAINHAKAAEVPMIVAINKIDLPDVDPNRVRTELLQHEVIVESMSGDTLEVEVSALKKQGLDTLLEAIAMQAELLELKANPDRRANGVVVEAKLERGRGPVGTVLVQGGTLRVGDIVVAGAAWGKVRALINDHGVQVKEAGPSVPVEVLGFNEAPEAGDVFDVAKDEGEAREITEYVVRERRRARSAGTGGARSLEQMMSQLKEADLQEFPLLVKADVQGSAEAIAGALEKLNTDEVAARIIHSGVGGVTESDVSLAAASNAVVMAFNTRANSQAKQAASSTGVEIRQYAIIYDIVNDVKDAMSGMLAPTIRETFLGNAEILEIFNISKTGKVAGCRVTEGRVERGAKVRLIRDNVVIHEGTLSTLKRFKDEVKDVQGGQECGMAFEKYEDMRVGDVIECFTTEEVARSL